MQLLKAGNPFARRGGSGEGSGEASGPATAPGGDGSGEPGGSLGTYSGPNVGCGGAPSPGACEGMSASGGGIAPPPGAGGIPGPGPRRTRGVMAPPERRRSPRWGRSRIALPATIRYEGENQRWVLTLGTVSECAIVAGSYLCRVFFATRADRVVFITERLAAALAKAEPTDPVPVAWIERKRVLDLGKKRDEKVQG